MRLRKHQVAVGLGSNLGDRLAHIRYGWLALQDLFSSADVSRVYETQPVGIENQPAFLNACCIGVTNLSPRRLLRSLQEIERGAGRTRQGRRFGPRTLDLDLLLYGDIVLVSPELTIPHAHLEERAFVLIPLADIGASWSVPGSGKSVAQLTAGIDASGVRRTELTLEEDAVS